MKTLRLLGIVTLLLGMVSCTTNYRMTTRIHRNGTVEREVWAMGDSAFMAGNLSKNPFLFSIDSGWKLTRLDSTIKFNFFGSDDKLNVVASRTIKPTGDFTFFSGVKTDFKPLVVPQEKLEKHFRWFYTYYTFTCKYDEIKDKGSVPLNRYLTDAQCKLLFQGDMTTCEGLNGLEISDELDDLRDKFKEWYRRSQYEVSYEVIRHFMKQEGDTTFLSQLKSDQERIFKSGLSDDSEKDFEPAYVCSLLDIAFHTKQFSQLYKRQSKPMDALYMQKCEIVNLFNYAFKYELAMPGTITSTNTQLREDDLLVWKVDAYRILADNYLLTAESRTINVWAFVVTGILVLFAGYCLMKGKRKKNG